jgi:DNA-binding XRE family transcriptional regulator
MFNRTKFQRVLDTAGLSRIEVAKVLNISRATLYLWLNGGEPHQRFLAPHINKACDAILIAVDKKLLPLPRRMSKEERRAKIARMAEKLQSIPSA